MKTLVADSPLTAVAFMPDGATLAIGSSRGKIYQYDLRILKSPVKTISAHKTSVQCIAFQYPTALSKVRHFLPSVAFLILLNKLAHIQTSYLVWLALHQNHFSVKKAEQVHFILIVFEILLYPSIFISNIL